MNRCTWFRSHKLGSVQKDGFQYCIRCGKAFLPPCDHNYELIQEIVLNQDWSANLVYGPKNPHIVRVYECSKCKNIKKEEINLERI